MAKALPAMPVTLHDWEGRRASVTVLSTVSCPLPLNLRRAAFQLVAIARLEFLAFPLLGHMSPTYIHTYIHIYIYIYAYTLA